MTTTRTPTTGAADLPEAGCSKHHLIHCSQCRHDNMVRDLRAENDRLTTQLAALAAGQATAAPAQPAAQQGAADGFFLLLPQRPKPEAPAGTVGLDWDAYSGAQMLAFGRDSSDAAIAALRTEQPAPSGATEEVENLRKALVYAAFALHGTPQYMLAQGIALIGGDTVRVSRDGWTVEASGNPYRQPTPAQAAEPVAWLRNTTDPQPHAVTNLKYRSAVDAEAGVEYTPVFAAPQPVARAPVAWKHDCAALLTNDVELWIDACPHCGKPRNAPQPVGRWPLTDAQIKGLIGEGVFFGNCKEIVRAIEAAHGIDIKGGQHVS